MRISDWSSDVCSSDLARRATAASQVASGEAKPSAGRFAPIATRIISHALRQHPLPRGFVCTCPPPASYYRIPIAIYPGNRPSDCYTRRIAPHYDDWPVPTGSCKEFSLFFPPNEKDALFITVATLFVGETAPGFALTTTTDEAS